MSDRGRFVRGLKKVKNVIAYSCSESLNSHKKTIKNLTFFWKISKSRGPIWPLLGFFFKKVILPKWSPYIALTSDQKSEKSLEPFLRKNRKKTFWPRFDPFLPKKRVKGIFFQKSLSVTFLHLSSPNCIQKIRKILRANSCNFVLQTDWQTN